MVLDRCPNCKSRGSLHCLRYNIESKVNDLRVIEIEFLCVVCELKTITQIHKRSAYEEHKLIRRLERSMRYVEGLSG